MKAPRIGVIGVQEGWSSHQLADSFAKKTGEKFLIEMSQVSYDLEKDQFRAGPLDLRSFDALVIKKISPVYSPDILNRLEILRHLEQQGVQIFASPIQISQMINRLNCVLKLKEGGIPMPPTIISENPQAILEALKQHGKLVLKPLYSTKARGMKLVENGPEALKTIEDFQQKGNPMIFAQKWINIPGKDLGVVFLGEDYLGTYARKAQGDWVKSSQESQKKYLKADPSPEVMEIAKKARKLFTLDFTCVDVVETEEGPMVFEVSAFGGYRGLLEACDIDAAERVVDYYLQKLSPT